MISENFRIDMTAIIFFSSVEKKVKEESKMASSSERVREMGTERKTRGIKWGKTTHNLGSGRR